MGLEFNDWIESGKKYAFGYASWIYSTLIAPWKTSPLLISTEDTKTDAARSVNLKGQNLVVIIAISIFIGATLGATIPGRPKFQDRATVLIVVCAIWLFVGFLIHGVCRLLGGKGSLRDSLFAILQSLSAVYVISNVITLIIINVARTFMSDSPSEFTFSNDPGAVLVLLQCMFLLYYIPASLAGIHQFKRVALGIVATFSAIVSLLIFFPIAQAGGCAAQVYYESSN
jgi:hypothetical protein